MVHALVSDCCHVCTQISPLNVTSWKKGHFVGEIEYDFFMF